MPRLKELRSLRRWEQGEKTGKWCERWIVYIVSPWWEERKIEKGGKRTEGGATQRKSGKRGPGSGRG